MPLLKRKKRFSVAYKRATHDKREYGTNKYIPHFLDLIAAKCRPDTETLQRIHVNSKTGRYKYTPSQRYQALQRLERIKRGKKERGPHSTQGTLF